MPLQIRRFRNRDSFLLGLSAVLIGCSPCKERIVTQVSSTDYVATVSKRDCGAMGKGSTLVSLRLKSVPDNDTHGVIVFAAQGDKTIETKWNSARSLLISCDSCTQNDVNFEVVKSGDVVVRYGSGLDVR